MSEWTRRSGVTRHTLSTARAEAVLDSGPIVPYGGFSNNIHRSPLHSAMSRRRVRALNAIEHSVDAGYEREADRRVLAQVHTPASNRGFSTEAHVDATRSTSPLLPRAVGDEDDGTAFAQGAAAAAAQDEYHRRRHQFAASEYEVGLTGERAATIGGGARALSPAKRPGLPVVSVPTRRGEPAREVSLDSPAFLYAADEMTSERAATLLASTDIREGEKERRVRTGLGGGDSSSREAKQAKGEGREEASPSGGAATMARLAGLANNLFGANVALPEPPRREWKPEWEGGQKPLFSQLHNRRQHERCIAFEIARRAHANLPPSGRSAAQLLTRYKAGGERQLVDEEAASRAEAMKNFIGKWMEKRGMESKEGPAGFRTSGKPGTSGAWAAAFAANRRK